jgi:hypothetical protein
MPWWWLRWCTIPVPEPMANIRPSPHPPPPGVGWVRVKLSVKTTFIRVKVPMSKALSLYIPKKIFGIHVYKLLWLNPALIIAPQDEMFARIYKMNSNISNAVNAHHYMGLYIL